MTEATQRFFIEIRPIQWRVPPFQIGRRNGRAFPVSGKDRELATYQEAIREELQNQGAEMLEPPYRLEMWFWRSLDISSDRQADATNLLKAAEDALQDVVINNDCNCRTVISHIVAQGREARNGIGIEITGHYTAKMVLPSWLQEIHHPEQPKSNWPPVSNKWP